MPIFFDNDCICSFSWVNRLDILIKLFKNNICIPASVMQEIERLKFAKSKYVYENIKKQIESGNFKVVELTPSDEFFPEFVRLTDKTKRNCIGQGEAEAIVLSKQHNGTLASNNLKDVLPHIQPNHPPLITTETILYLAFVQKIITFQEGQQILIAMKQKNRKLSTYDFSELIKKWENM